MLVDVLNYPFSSAFSLAYHGFLRVGEFTANSKGKNQIIRIEHFKFKTNHKSGEHYIEVKKHISVKLVSQKREY